MLSTIIKFGAPFLITGIVVGLAIGLLAVPQTPQKELGTITGGEIRTLIVTKTMVETKILEAAKPVYKWRIKIASTGGYFEANLPVLVAMAKGYLDEEGIKVDEFVTVKGGADARKLLVAGQVDFIAQSTLHAGIAISAGADVKTIVLTYKLSSIGLCISSSLKDRVKNISDLKGLVIGISSFGSLTWAMANYYISKAGLDPNKDVTFAEIGADLPAIVAALQQGKIHAYTCFGPVLYTLTSKGIAFTLINPYDYEQHKKWIGEASLEAGILTRGDIIQRDPELILRMVNAIKKALLYIAMESPENIAKTLINNEKVKQYVGYSEEDLVGIIKTLKPGFSISGSFNPKAWETSPYVLLQQALPKEFKPVSFEQAIYWRFAGLEG
ncbi:MAG: ABC transporter substrate-binding protein [Sulfolobales archaeon]